MFNFLRKLFRAWTLRDIIVAVILSAACGAVYMGWDNLTMPVFSGTLSPVVQGLVNGVWWLAAGLVAYIVRRPGAALVAGVVSAFFEFLFGSPYGIGALVSGLVQGGGAEVAFAVFGWRRYNTWTLALSGALGGVGNTLQWLFQYGGDKYPMGIMLGYLLSTMVSGLLVAGILPVLIGKALMRTGVLRNYEIARQAG